MYDDKFFYFFLSFFFNFVLFFCLHDDKVSDLTYFYFILIVDLAGNVMEIVSKSKIFAFSVFLKTEKLHNLWQLICPFSYWEWEIVLFFWIYGLCCCYFPYENHTPINGTYSMWFATVLWNMFFDLQTLS